MQKFVSTKSEEASWKARKGYRILLEDGYQLNELEVHVFETEDDFKNGRASLSIETPEAKIKQFLKSKHRFRIAYIESSACSSARTSLENKLCKISELEIRFDGCVFDFLEGAKGYPFGPACIRGWAA